MWSPSIASIRAQSDRARTQCMARKRKQSRVVRMLARVRQAARRRGGKCLSTVYHGIAKTYQFECRNKHTFPARAEHILHSGSWCPYCAHGRVTNVNNLAVQYPSIAAEWHPLKNTLTPREVTSTSQYRVWWQCSLGHEWFQGIGSRTKTRNKFTHGDCPTCGSL